MKRYWIIRGFDGSSKIFEATASYAQLRGKAIERVLFALAARHLSPEEIVSSFVGKQGLLEAKRGSSGIVTCGENPHYVAHLESFAPVHKK